MLSAEFTHIPYTRRGSIEVIAGPMFSGKTEELIRRLKRAQIARLNVEIFKPFVDTRYDETEIVSHDKHRIPSSPVENSSSILLLLNSNVQVVGIDEGQFFDNELLHVCNKMANKGLRVIVAGLDMDYLGQPFGPMAPIIACAEHVSKLSAICMKCGAPAHFSYRLIDNDSKVMLGEKESYEPRCRVCFNSSK